MSQLLDAHQCSQLPIFRFSRLVHVQPLQQGHSAEQDLTYLQLSREKCYAEGLVC